MSVAHNLNWFHHSTFCLDLSIDVCIVDCKSFFWRVKAYLFLLYRVERLPHRGGRTPLFTAQQEILIVDMVRENNTIRLREIKERVIADNVNFGGIDRVSLATIDRLLRRQQLRMKQAYRVPFERNSDRVKELRYQYVQVSIHTGTQCWLFTVQWVYKPTVLHSSPQCTVVLLLWH